MEEDSLLVGTVIPTGAFYVYTTTNNSNNLNNNTQMNDGQPPEMPSGQNNQSVTENIVVDSISMYISCMWMELN